MGTVFEAKNPALAVLDAAEYRLLGADGAAAVGGGATVANLGRGGALAAATVVSAAPAWTWEPSLEGHRALHLDGAADKVHLPIGLLASRTQGTVMVLFKIAAGANTIFADSNLTGG